MLQANTSGYPHTAIYVYFLRPTVPMTSRGILINMLLASACELDLFDRTGKEKCFYKDICIPFKNIWFLIRQKLADLFRKSSLLL